MGAGRPARVDETDLLAAEGVDDYAVLRVLARQLIILLGSVIFLSVPFPPAVISTPPATNERGPMRPWGGCAYIGKRREGLGPVGRFIFLLLLVLVVEPVTRSS